MKKLLFLILTILLCFNFTYKEEYNTKYNIYTSSNNDIFNKVKEIELLAKEYIKETSSNKTSTDLTINYIRRNRYNNTLWTSFLGPIDTNFISYVESKNTNLNIDNNTIIIDKQNQEIDFIHMLTTLNAYYLYNQTKSSIIDVNYAGWAGDLTTLLEEVIIYRTNNNVSNKELQIYTDSLLGTNNISTFSKEDILSDIDALNISKIDTLNTNLYQTLIDYYETNKTINCSNNRFLTIQDHFKSKENALNNAKNILNNKLVTQMIIPNTSSKITENDILVLSESFSKYIFKEKQETFDIKSGQTINIDIKQNETNATCDKDILSIIQEAQSFKIEAKKYGQTYIHIKNNKNEIQRSIKINITNVKPEIEKDLANETNYKFKNNEEITFEIKAKGTNNIYTWYLYNERTNKKEKLLETNEPKIKLKITNKLKNKYLYCEIKNEGNNKIESSKLKIELEPTIFILLLPALIAISIIICFIITFKKKVGAN